MTSTTYTSAVAEGQDKNDIQLKFCKLKTIVELRFGYDDATADRTANDGPL